MILKDKVAWITGAAGDLGKAISCRFAEEGALVALADAKPSAALALAERIDKDLKRAMPLEGDVSSMNEVEEMASRVIRRFDRIDILVCCAGVRRDLPLDRLNEETWDLVVQTNLKGSFNCALVAQRSMVKKNWGRVIFLSSPIPPGIGPVGHVPYSSASAGIEGLTKSLALELGPYNITVNCICPDFIDTEMTRKAARSEGLYLEDLKKLIVPQIPLGRLGRPEEVAGLALFLASDAAGFITGQIVHIKGGP